MTTTTTTTACPDLEQLAAFADGRLSGAARDAVVEHLADCEDCYEVYAETLRVQEDLGQPVEDDPPAPVVVHPRSFRPPRWLVPAAALAAAAALAVVVVPWRLGTPIVPVGNLSSLSDGWHEHDWPRKRGGPGIETFDIGSNKRAFRLGVHAVDLRAALQLGDRDQATTQARSIESLLDDFSGFLSPLYEQLRDGIEAGDPQAELLTSAFKNENMFTKEPPLVDPLFFSFGKWTETARLAALTGDVDYFTGFFFGREYRRGLRKLQEGELAEDVAAKLERVEELVETGPSPEALEQLSQVLEEIISGEGVR